jgi:hypothetical protein
MKVPTTLRQILSKEFHETFKRVMENWSEAKDIHAFVKIAQSLEAEAKDYSAVLAELTKKTGYDWEGERIVDLDRIQDKLLQKFGKFNANSQISLADAPDEKKTEFLSEKDKAEACIKKYKSETDLLLDQDLELDIPRLLKVTPNHIKKGLTPRDCFILSPIFDLSAVSDPVTDAEVKA